MNAVWPSEYRIQLPAHQHREEPHKMRRGAANVSEPLCSRTKDVVVSRNISMQLTSLSGHSFMKWPSKVVHTPNMHGKPCFYDRRVISTSDTVMVASRLSVAEQRHAASCHAMRSPSLFHEFVPCTGHAFMFSGGTSRQSSSCQRTTIPRRRKDYSCKCYLKNNFRK